MAARKKTEAEVTVVEEVAVKQPEKMEFRLINPTEGGFLREIKWNKEELEEAVRQKISEYENVVYTEDNMKQAKADRAELNKLTKAIEDRRKKVKNIIMEPYTTFEKEIKEVLELIEEPVGIIGKQITAFEDQQKDEKKKSIQKSYDEVIGNLAEVLPFEKVFDSRYLNQTYKLATAQTEVKTKVEKVRTDLETIDSLESKYKLNAKDVYIKTLDLSKALAENKRLSDLEEKLEAEKKRKAEEDAERKRHEEELRKAAEKKAEEEQRNEQKKAEPVMGHDAQVSNVQSDIPIGKVISSIEHQAFSVAVSGKGVSKEPESVPNPQENVSEPEKSVVEPPTGDASVTDPFAPQEDTKQYKASFTIYGTKAQIMAVKQYMINNNVKFGKVEK